MIYLPTFGWLFRGKCRLHGSYGTGSPNIDWFFEWFVSRKDGMNILRVDFNRFWREKSSGFNGWLEFQGFFEYPLVKWVSFVKSTPTDSQPFLLIDVSGIRYKTRWGTLRDYPKKYDEIWGYRGILHFISFPSMPPEMEGVLLIFYGLGSHGMKITITISPQKIRGEKNTRQTVDPFFTGHLYGWTVPPFITIIGAHFVVTKLFVFFFLFQCRIRRKNLLARVVIINTILIPIKSGFNQAHSVPDVGSRQISKIQLPSSYPQNFRWPFWAMKISGSEKVV